MSDKRSDSTSTPASKRAVEQPAPADRAGSLPKWLAPVAVLLVVAAVVWWFVFRENPTERGTRLLAEARTAMQANDFATAEARLQEAIKLAPQNGVLQHNLGILYLNQSRLPEARQAFERAVVAHGPNASEVRAEEFLQLATVSYMEKNWPQAAAELEKAIAANPTRTQLHTRLLDLQLGRLSQPAAAESTTSRFLRLCGRSPRNLCDAGYVHYQNRSYATSQALAQQAVALQDSFVEGQALLARSMWKTGHPADGLRTLAGPLQRYPKSPELWVAQALLLLDLRQGTQALAAADRAVALAPRDFQAHQARQTALAAIGRTADALQEIEVTRGLTNDPGNLRMLAAQQRLLRGLMGRAPGQPAAADSAALRP